MNSTKKNLPMRGFLYFFLFLILWGCTKEDKPHLNPGNSESALSPVDTVYASMPEMAKDNPPFTSVEDLLSEYHWKCVKSEVYSILAPSDTFYHEIREPITTWAFTFRPIGWGFPYDTLVGGDLKIFVENGYSSVPFELENNKLEFSNQEHFFHQPARHQDSSFSFQLKQSIAVNDSVTRVALQKMQSISKPAE